jgi:two-component system, LuxR family, secretion system response regulator SsrB
MAGSNIRVVVADDYEPLRRFISSTLKSMPELQVIGEVSDGLSAIEKARELQADMIVLDVHLPKLNGFEVARRIREHLPQIKIIFISEDRYLAKDALHLGANGYVVKSDAGCELVPALKAVLQGKQYVSLSLVRRLHPAVT